jgi:hypothetical protein
MKSKILSLVTVMGIFALASVFMSQISADLQTSFAAKGGQPGCGVDSKGDSNSQGKCLKEPKCVDTDEVLCDGGDPGDSDGSD